MLGGKNTKPLGYTIVEVMIVLAVSGVMFLIAATFINGKQQKTAFRTGVNEMASQIQDVIEQVTDGRYSDIGLQCIFSPGVSTVVSEKASSNQGTNSDCVFLGKILYFNNKNAHNYLAFSVAGGRLDATDASPKLNDAMPTVVDSLTIEQNSPQQLDVLKVTEVDASPPNSQKSFTAIGFFQNAGSPKSGTVARQGAQAVYLYYVDGAAGGTYVGAYTGTATLAQNLKQAQTADICVTDGSQYADITLGTGTAGSSTGGQLTANVKMDGTTPCAP